MVHQEIMIYLYLNKGHSFSYVYYNRFHWLKLKLKLKLNESLIRNWFVSYFDRFFAFSLLLCFCLVDFITLWHHSFQLWWFQISLCRFWQISRCCFFFLLSLMCALIRGRFTWITIRKCETDIRCQNENKPSFAFVSFLCSFIFNLTAMFCDLARYLFGWMSILIMTMKQ